MAVARPELAMVAAVVLLELHVTEPVRFFVDPSLYVPVAAYCCVPPTVSEVDAGVTEMEARTTFVVPVTVSVADAVSRLNAA